MIAGLSSFCTVIILKIYFVDPVKPLPGWLHTTVITGLGTILCIKEKTEKSDVTNHQQDNIPDNGGHSVNAANTNHDKDGVDQHQAIMLQIDGLRSCVEHIQRDLHQMMSQWKVSNEEVELKKMWKLAARILDRFFLIIYMTAMIATLIGMLIVYPSTVKIT